MIAGLAACAAAAADIAADACCPRCGHRPASAGDPLGRITAAIAAQPLARENRKRTKTERSK